MPVNIFVFLGMVAVGFPLVCSELVAASMTPLLIFNGIPAAVVRQYRGSPDRRPPFPVLLPWRRNNVDIKMGTVLLTGGIAGSLVGVEAVKLLRQIGQFEFFVSVAYVTFSASSAC